VARRDFEESFAHVGRAVRRHPFDVMIGTAKLAFGAIEILDRSAEMRVRICQDQRSDVCAERQERGTARRNRQSCASPYPARERQIGCT